MVCHHVGLDAQGHSGLRFDRFALDLDGLEFPARHRLLHQLQDSGWQIGFATLRGGYECYRCTTVKPLRCRLSAITARRRSAASRLTTGPARTRHVVPVETCALST